MLRQLVRRSAPVLALLVLAGPLAARALQDSEPPAVRLAAPQTVPGGETFVTMMLDTTPATPVQAIRSEIEFHTGQLTYVTSRLAFASDLANATLDVVPQKVETPPGAAAEHKLGERMRLVVTVTGKKIIPTGPVVEMRFKVAPGLDGVNVKLDQRATATTPEGTPVARLGSPVGEIVISSEGKAPVPIVYGCFFYMH